MDKRTRYSPEVRERAVRLVQAHTPGARVAVGRNPVDCPESWVHGGDAAAVGAAGGA